MDFKNYITPLGLKRLQDEFNFLKKTERPKVTNIVTWAASLGDRSENADYQYGKKRLREIDRRLRFLGKRIENAEVIDPVNQIGNSVRFGATVRVEDLLNHLIEYKIVGEDEIDSSLGLISWKSPVGKALLGKEVGDNILVKAPKGPKELEIISIEFKEISVKEFVYEGDSGSQFRGIS